MEHVSATEKLKAIIKVKKLVALSSSTNANEATLAKEMAAKIITKFKLTQNEIKDVNPQPQKKLNPYRKQANNHNDSAKAAKNHLDKIARLQKLAVETFRYSSLSQVNSFLEITKKQQSYLRLIEIRLLKLRAVFELGSIEPTSFIFKEAESELASITKTDPRTKSYYPDIQYLCGLINLKNNRLEAASHYFKAAAVAFRVQNRLNCAELMNAHVLQLKSKAISKDKKRRGLESSFFPVFSILLLAFGLYVFKS